MIWAEQNDVVTILWRYEGSPETSGDSSNSVDAVSISSWAADAVAWGSNNGIASGIPDGLANMKGEATRAAVATFLMNYIHEKMGGDLFQIVTVEPYPDYDATLDKAQQEPADNARPELSGSVGNIDDYDVVFIGYPIWWGTAPMAVRTFLESYDFSGKTIIPFSTHGGSGFSKTIDSIKNAEPDATVLDGLAIRDTNANNADGDVAEWLNSLGIID